MVVVVASCLKGLKVSSSANFLIRTKRGKSKATLVTGLDRPSGLWEVEAPRFWNNCHMKVASLSALRTGCLNSPRGIFLILVSVTDWVNPRAIVQAEELCQWKIPVTPFGIEPMTFCLVAQCLNQLHSHRPEINLNLHKSWTGIAQSAQCVCFQLNHQRHTLFLLLPCWKFGTESHQTSTQGTSQAIFAAVKQLGVKLTTDLNLLPMLKLCRPVTSHPTSLWHCSVNYEQGHIYLQLTTLTIHIWQWGSQSNEFED